MIFLIKKLVVKRTKDEDDLPDIDEVELPECEKFEILYLIRKMLGESVPLKTSMSEIKFFGCLHVRLNMLIWVMDLFLSSLLMKWIAIMYSLVNPGLFKDSFNLQRWMRDFDSFKESIKWILIWVRSPGLPVELWSESILRKLLKQIGKVIKIDID